MANADRASSRSRMPVAWRTRKTGRFPDQVAETDSNWRYEGSIETDERDQMFGLLRTTDVAGPGALGSMALVHSGRSAVGRGTCGRAQPPSIANHRAEGSTDRQRRSTGSPER